MHAHVRTGAYGALSFEDFGNFVRRCPCSVQLETPKSLLHVNRVINGGGDSMVGIGGRFIYRFLRVGRFGRDGLRVTWTGTFVGLPSML